MRQSLFCTVHTEMQDVLYAIRSNITLEAVEDNRITITRFVRFLRNILSIKRKIDDAAFGGLPG